MRPSNIGGRCVGGASHVQRLLGNKAGRSMKTKRISSRVRRVGGRKRVGRRPRRLVVGRRGAVAAVRGHAEVRVVAAGHLGARGERVLLLTRSLGLSLSLLLGVAIEAQAVHGTVHVVTDSRGCGGRPVRRGRGRKGCGEEGGQQRSSCHLASQVNVVVLGNEEM